MNICRSDEGVGIDFGLLGVSYVYELHGVEYGTISIHNGKKWSVLYGNSQIEKDRPEVRWAEE